MKKFVQFIAGAICPNCKSNDTIALNPEDDQIYCIKCDFIEDRPIEEADNKAKEINVLNIQDFKKNTSKNQ